MAHDMQQAINEAQHMSDAKEGEKRVHQPLHSKWMRSLLRQETSLRLETSL
jgi:hypothetical protein